MRRRAMALFDDKVRQQLKDILGTMKEDVRLLYFTQENECPVCRDTGLFVEEMGSLAGMLKVAVHDFVADRTVAAQYGIDKIPAIALLDAGGNDPGIRFFGLPGGYEINSFISAIMELSGKREPLPDDIAKRVKAVAKDVHIQVFVSLTCPLCPSAVATAHRLAMENRRIRADMIDANAFMPLAIRHHVTGVPKIIFNEKTELVGAHPMTVFLDTIEKL